MEFMHIKVRNGAQFTKLVKLVLLVSEDLAGYYRSACFRANPCAYIHSDVVTHLSLCTN